MTQHNVQRLLAEWREAERQLEQTDDARQAAELRARIDEARDAYQRAVATADASNAVGTETA